MQQSSMFDATASEKILSVLRQRSRVNQLMEGLDEDEQIQGKTQEDDIEMGERTQLKSTTGSNEPETTAAARWGKLRKVVRGFSENSKVLLDNAPLDTPIESPRNTVDDSAQDLELEDIELSDFWNSEKTIPQFKIDETVAPDTTIAPINENIDKSFLEDVAPMKVGVNRIAESIIKEKQDEIENAVFHQFQKSVDNVKKLHTDVIWREDLARSRVLEMERRAKEKITNEKLKIIQLKLNQENTIKKQFRIAREELEVGIKRQEGAIREHFGKLLIHEDSLARRFQVFTRLFPQPIEIRIHLLRAVKDKLSKGSYVLMLTQYDAMGGNPLTWSNIGANGIGKIRPGITRIVKHNGRYFDRVMRFEDSCFALCPPRPMIKPSYVFVFELFQLASHFNPTDKIVAWTAVPMSFESMSIIEGKIKLPLLRGEHSPAVQHFSKMEKLMASDLNNWLCNMYLEVRHMSLQELGATDNMLKSSDFDLDYLNKQILTDSYHQASQERQLSHEEAMLQAMKHSSLSPAEVLLDKNADGKLDDGIYSQLLVKQYSKRLATLQMSSKSNNKLTDKAPASSSPKADQAETQQEKAKELEKAEMKEDKKSSESKNDIESILPAEKGIFRRKISQVTNPSTLALPPDYPHSRKSNHDSELKIHNSYALPPNSSWMDRINFGWKRLSDNILHRNSADSENSHQSFSNFSDYRLQLIQQWKDKINNQNLQQQRQGNISPPPMINQNGSRLRSQPLSDEEDEKNDDLEVRERGYNLQDEVLLHKEQRGKLFGMETLMDKDSKVWANAGLEGKIVRRWQSEGSRFDSDAVPDPVRENAHNPDSHLGESKDEKWEELRDNREMLEYTMTIASDPTRKKHLVPGSIARSKLRYLSQELFGDMVPSAFGTFDFTISLFLYALAAWIRIYIHYLAQYLFLLAESARVYAFELHVLFVSFKYSSVSLTTATEVGVVAIGPIATTLIFMLMVICGTIMYKQIHYFPTVLSKFFAYYGVVNILSPVLIFLIDLFYHHYSCELVSAACKENYNSADCACYTGDFIKLWYRMINVEGSGFTGAFITALIYLGIGVVSCICLHEYLLYIHRSGRVLDLWRRINASSAEEFFIPDDFEISVEELKFILKKNQLFNQQSKHLNIERKIVIQEGYETQAAATIAEDNNDSSIFSMLYSSLRTANSILPMPKPVYCKRYLIYQKNKETKQEFLFRHFLLNESGQILEIFHDLQAKNVRGKNNNAAENQQSGGENHLFNQVVNAKTTNNLTIDTLDGVGSLDNSLISPGGVMMHTSGKMQSSFTTGDVDQNDGIDDMDDIEHELPQNYLPDDGAESPHKSNMVKDPNEESDEDHLSLRNDDDSLV